MLEQESFDFRDISRHSGLDDLHFRPSVSTVVEPRLQAYQKCFFVAGPDSPGEADAQRQSRDFAVQFKGDARPARAGTVAEALVGVS